MENFTFHNPTRLHFGRGQIAALDRDLPADARWLEPAERAALTEAVESERAAAITRPRAGLGELLLDVRLLFFCWVYFAIQLTIYAVTFWLPEIIRGMGGLSDLQVGLFNSIPWLISIAGMYLFAVAAAHLLGLTERQQRAPLCLLERRLLRRSALHVGQRRRRRSRSMNRPHKRSCRR